MDANMTVNTTNPVVKVKDVPNGHGFVLKNDPGNGTDPDKCYIRTNGFDTPSVFNATAFSGRSATFDAVADAILQNWQVIDA